MLRIAYFKASYLVSSQHSFEFSYALSELALTMGISSLGTNINTSLFAPVEFMEFWLLSSVMRTVGTELEHSIPHASHLLSSST